MSEEKRDEMAETMKDAAIQEMREELEATGYVFQAEHFEGMSSSDFEGWIQAPDDTWIQGETFGYKMQNDWEDAKIKADNSCIEKAYAHLQKERKFQAMEALLERIMVWNKDIDIQDNPTEYAFRIWMGIRQEAKQISDQ